MNDKYKNKYRICSVRAPFWDYGWEGAYFVTICTKYRECFFGDIKDGIMTLSRLETHSNLIEPFQEKDSIAFYVTVKNEKNHGQFVSPKSKLIKKIIYTVKKKGKELLEFIHLGIKH